MYAKGKDSTVPSDPQAREKLALYVYEYLLHVGAQKAAQTFLSEIRWEKNITLGEPPGFLHSWWCLFHKECLEEVKKLKMNYFHNIKYFFLSVTFHLSFFLDVCTQCFSVFWDLYCAAPERRETCEHSTEGKAFHDYGFINSGYAVNGMTHGFINSGYAVNGMTHNPTVTSPLSQMAPGDGMPGGAGGPTGFFPNSHIRSSLPQQSVSQPSHSQPPPSHTLMVHNQSFMSPRYPTQSVVRMGQQVDFSSPGNVPEQHMIHNSVDPTRPADGEEFVSWQGPQGMNPMNSRINPQRVQHLGQMNPGSYETIRPPGRAVVPGIPPLSMQGPGGRQWQPNMSAISYSSLSPGSHYGPPISVVGPQRSGTPIMPSPQGSSGPFSPENTRINPSNLRPDSSSSGGESMYAIMKTVPAGGPMSGFPLGPGPDGHIGPMGPDMGTSVLNGMSSAGTIVYVSKSCMSSHSNCEGLDGMKNSPINGPSTPREDVPPMGEYGISGYGQENQDQNESAAILKLKETMWEKVKRFGRKKTPSVQQEYYLQ
ncbi:single-stranded DNA-binding protein 3-like isoform X3 [Tachypleus tridentatus]|uniref:single-stranded DNA-binding protein 3-like isoform X3 n=1 Tax=Tachypleus tridentatus TaxID=6853 RepID=UPI003FD0FA52